MKKFLVRLAIFTCLTLGLNIVLNMFLHPYEYDRYKIRYDYLKNNLSKFNTIFWGSSRTLRHVNPDLYDSLALSTSHPTQSFNLGSPANRSFETYEQYEKFLADYKQMPVHNIKSAFIEIHPLEYIDNKNLGTKRSYYWLNFQNFLLINQYFSSHKATERVFLMKNFTLSLLFNKLGFNYFFINDQVVDPIVLGNSKKGYISLEEEVEKTHDEDQKIKLLANRKVFLQDTNFLVARKETAIKNFNVQQEQPAKSSLVHLNYLKELLKRSKEVGIELVYIIQPRLNSYKEVLAIKNGLPAQNIIEIANPEAHAALWRSSTSYDIGHMNKQGSTIFTNLLFTHVAGGE